MALLGIDLGGTKLATAVFTEDGAMISEETVLVDGREGPAVGGLIAERLQKFLDEQALDGDDVRSIGICVPGISYQRSGTVWAPNIPGWDSYPLMQELRQTVRSIPIAIDSDRACYILGELWEGVAQGCRDAIFMAVGTGIGAGILVDGKVLRGAHDIAGSIGWMGLESPYRDKYVECGHFETYASGEGIPKFARELMSEDDSYNGVLRAKPPGELVTLDVFDAYDQGDPIAEKIFRRCIEFWGMAVANLVSIFNPEKIIFGGGVFGPGIRFLPEIHAEARKWAQPVAMRKVLIEPSSLGNHAGLFGAGLLAMRNLNGE
jgi:glucokinase